ncbi:hypothetical protein [Kytococcus sedentarius]|uniref:FitA-like ribbon-helix-helix domain-containing protein n=1 Tax=Kytococcus sedentarius TaxID=1276 RepID=UPI0035BC7F5B
MSTIQIRNVPEELSRTLKARATLEGRSLSDYLLRELQQIAERPSRAELLARIRTRGVRDLPPAAEVLSTERPAR